MAAGQALVVVPVVSPAVVMNSYAIPDTVLTAAYQVLSYWPFQPLFLQKSIEVFVPPPIIRKPDALSKVGLSSHAKLFHNPTRSNVLGLTGSDDPMQVQSLKAILEQCHSGFRSIPVAVIGAIEDPANLISLRGKPRMKLHVPDEQIVCIQEDSNEVRLFAHIVGNKRLGLLEGEWPFGDIHHDSWVGRVIVYGLPVVTLERANT